MTSRFLSPVRLALVLALLAIPAHLLAADNEGITVTAVGTAKAKATSVELSTNVSANAELTADALVKFKDAKAKAVAALEGLKFSQLKIEPQGVAMNLAIDQQQQMRMMQGMGGTSTSKPRIEVAEQLKLVIKDVDKLQPQETLDMVLKVVDTIRDAGLNVGPPPPTNYYQMQIQAQSGRGAAVVSFRVDDADPVREKAYQEAVDAARKKAEKLASLSGVKLGPVLSVKEGPAQDAQNFNPYRYAYGLMGNDNEQSEVSGPVLGEIPVKIMLTMQFGIAK